MENTTSNEALESLYEYSFKLIEAINKTVDHIRSQQTEKTINILPKIIEGLQWCIEVLHYTKDIFANHGIMLDEEQIKETFGELLDAMEYDDTVLLSDIFEYEVVDILKGWREGLEKVLDIDNEV
ncbi:hypothetical protein [Wukongibacter sp. M2B1]|uniref:hypothetical protein n=1 Tax=Wukongibacter sp. M2B1 TaxID=3088895 RepID=UPI003D7AAA87